MDWFKQFIVSFTFIIAAIIVYQYSPQLFLVNTNISELNNHLQEISQQPAPHNSHELARKANYIQTKIQKHPNLELKVISGTTQTDIGETSITNIIAFKPGKSGTSTTLFSAHYDTEFLSPGANDDGVAVASMLSLLGDLNNQAYENNIAFVFLDAEELGLGGSRHLVDNLDQYQLGDISTIYNFEARGIFGPVFMFESFPEGLSSSSQIIEASPNLYHNSLATTLYALLPNNTDLTEYKRIEGTSDYNFGYFYGLRGYHSPADSFANTSSQTKKQVLHTIEKLLEDQATDYTGSNYVTTSLRSGKTNLSVRSQINFNLVAGTNLFIPKLLGILFSAIVLITTGREFLTSKFKKGQKSPSLVLMAGLAAASLIGIVIILKAYNYFNFWLAGSAILLAGLAVASTQAIIYRYKLADFSLKALFLLLFAATIVFYDYLFIFNIQFSIFLLSLFVSSKIVEQKLKNIVLFVGLGFVSLISAQLIWNIVWLLDNQVIMYPILLILLFLYFYQAFYIQRYINLSPARISA